MMKEQPPIKFIRFETCDYYKCCVNVDHIVVVKQNASYTDHYFVKMTNGDEYEVDTDTAETVIASLIPLAPPTVRNMPRSGDLGI